MAVTMTIATLYTVVSISRFSIDRNVPKTSENRPVNGDLHGKNYCYQSENFVDLESH
jgi:hypothetical protein